MVNIRYSRLRKFRRKGHKLVLTVQVVAIWYVVILSVGYLTSNTGAYFNDHEGVSGTIQAGIWDDYTLQFTNNGNQNENEFSCSANSLIVSTKIKNIGTTDMQSSVTYELYFSETGYPEKDGIMVSKGEIPALTLNQEYELSTTVAKEGFYTFKTFEKSDQQIIIWSDKIKVKCKAVNNKKQNEKLEAPKSSNEEETQQTIPEELKIEKPEISKDNIQESIENVEVNVNVTVTESVTESITEEGGTFNETSNSKESD